jgi:hypothetical protein
VMVSCHNATGSSGFAEVRGKVFAHFHSHCKTLQQYVEPIVWPARATSLRTTLEIKKIISMFLTLFFICFAFFGLGEFRLSVHGSRFLPRTLV